MNARSLRAAASAALLAAAGCARTVAREADAASGVDSLNARLTQAYREHDPRKYGALFTDSAVFEWPAFNTARGKAALEAMARSNWTTLREMDLQLTVAHRRFAQGHVTEFGAFRQSWSDSAGGRMAEFGRYVAVLVPGGGDGWLIDRFFGFSDSTRSIAR